MRIVNFKDEYREYRRNNFEVLTADEVLKRLEDDCPKDFLDRPLCSDAEFYIVPKSPYVAFIYSFADYDYCSHYVVFIKHEEYEKLTDLLKLYVEEYNIKGIKAKYKKLKAEINRLQHRFALIVAKTESLYDVNSMLKSTIAARQLKHKRIELKEFIKQVEDKHPEYKYLIEEEENGSNHKSDILLSM